MTTPNLPAGDVAWLWIERVSALTAAAGVLYLVYDKRQHTPHFRFQFAGQNRQAFVNQNLTFGRITFSGSIQNTSLDPNTIERVYLVVWRTARKRNTRRLGFGGIEVKDSAGTKIGPPLSFQPRESKPVTIACEFPLTGTGDDHLFNAMKPLPGNPNFLLPAYSYELAFEDVGGNFFDTNGLPRSRRLIDLLWTLDNAWQRFRDGHPMMLLNHARAITWEELRFSAKRLLRLFGL